MTRSNIKNKDGRISAYGFACGYIEAVALEKIKREGEKND